MAAGDKLPNLHAMHQLAIATANSASQAHACFLNTYHLWKLEEEEEEEAISSKTGACNAPVRSEKPVHSPHDKW